jgi:hypothetical protein
MKNPFSYLARWCEADSTNRALSFDHYQMLYDTVSHEEYNHDGRHWSAAGSHAP